MPDQTTTALRHVPDWSIVVLSDEPQQLGVVTNLRPRCKVLVKTSRDAGQFLPGDQPVRIWKYPAELAHDCFDTHQTMSVDVSVPTHVHAMLHGSDRDRSWTGNPAMRAIMMLLKAAGVKQRDLLNNEHVLVLERQYRCSSCPTTAASSPLVVTAIHSFRCRSPGGVWRCAWIPLCTVFCAC